MKENEYINSVNINSSTNFPYLVLDVKNDESHPKNPGFQVMHWHEDVQFIYVLDGEVEVLTLDSVTNLRKSEGVFINKNVVHTVRRVDSCHYKSFIFPDKFLTFYFGSPAEKIVERLIGQENFLIFHIENIAKNKAVTNCLQKLAELENNKMALYEYEVLTTLCTLWLELCRVVDLPEEKQKKNAVSRRMSTFLLYIEEHYSEEISLDELAESAHVSKSECLRCFRKSLMTTPYKYLTEYRLSKAAVLLRETDRSISDIAADVGFGQLSHFGKCFREKTGLSPSAYRKNK